MKHTIKIPPIGRHSKLFGNEKGMVMAVVLMLVAVLVILGTTAIMTVTTDMKIAGNYRESQKALYNAEAGVETVIAYLRTNTVSYYPTANATTEIINAGTCPTANNCRTVPTPVPCTCAQIPVTVPTGFLFSNSVNIYGYDVSKRIYLFRMTGTGYNNASKTIETYIAKLTFSDEPVAADGAVAMYGGGPAVQFKTGGGGGYALDGHDYPVPPSSTCNGSACETTATASPAVPGLYTVMSPTITGDEAAHLGGVPTKTLGASRQTEYNDFVNNVLASGLYQATLGTRANPAITVIPNGATLNGTGNGAGIIIVDDGGSLQISGNFEYEGLVILRGSGKVFGAGTGNIFGSLITIGHTAKLIDLTGGINLFYSSTALGNLSNINNPSANTTIRVAWRDVF